MIMSDLIEFKGEIDSGAFKGKIGSEEFSGEIASRADLLQGNSKAKLFRIIFEYFV